MKNLKTLLSCTLVMLVLFAVGGNKVASEKERTQVVFEYQDDLRLDAQVLAISVEAGETYVELTKDAMVMDGLEVPDVDGYPELFNLGTVNLYTATHFEILNKGSPA